jgi:hypothetical protein
MILPKQAYMDCEVHLEDTAARMRVAEARVAELEAEFGHLRGKPIVYGSEATKLQARVAELEDTLEMLIHVAANWSISPGHQFYRRRILEEARNVLYRGSQYRTETPPEVERRSREILEERHNPDCSDEITEY